MADNSRRLSRAKKTRAQISRLDVPRLCVHRTNKHIYAQIISNDAKRVLAAASTLSSDLEGKYENGGNKAAAMLVGELIAGQAKKVGILKVAFDRSGFKYHGRISALADAARANGLLI